MIIGYPSSILGGSKQLKISYFNKLNMKYLSL
jgi:hypothetical protein